jgi:uncharacterized protein
MNELEQLIAKLSEDLPFVRKKYRVKSLGLFGSYVRGKQHENSDVDILVEFDQPIGLLKFMSLEIYLSELLGKRVDLVMKTALKPAIGRHILSEVKYI